QTPLTPKTPHPLSSNAQKLIHILHPHIIKSSKLYLHHFQSTSTIPQPHKRFYTPCLHLAQHHPILHKQQPQKIKILSHHLNQPIYQPFKYLNINQQNHQPYLQTHLLSLPPSPPIIYY
ncbi:putative inorganic carbon transporter subunit DabA, partial [Staphylococcus capitis]|uniref:putative inorganic carbon transporter subunit DabA n=1 Tax=Staphylococcus capitis TaxID=29388 RepID=UPI0011A57743